MDQTRSALIIASDEYTDPRLRRLRAPASDARALAAVLQDPGIGGFEVRTLLNEPAHVVTLAVEEFFADRHPGDLLLVHFSGHGVKDEDGELYFAAANTVLGRLGATAVAAEFVGRRMNRSRSRRVVLLLDCCYAGAFERGLVARAGVEMGIEQQFGGRGRAVITASSAMEYAFEAGELADAREVAPSVFTSALVEGLETGEADQDQDGLVGLDELYDYVYDKVRAATPNQTPGKWVFGVEGDLHIARRARPVTTPAPLPPELQQAIDSPLAGVRAGAVAELAAVLRGRHAGMALAARLALEQLTEDDSRAVAAAATAALGVQPLPVPPQPPPPELALSATVIDLGQIPLHSQSPERRVRVGNAGGGDLNARAATSASWLKLRQAGDELMVAVDTSAAGDYEGIVTVDSDGGTGTVRVHARVGPDLRPATGAAATTRPQPVPEPPVGAQPGPQQDPALPGTSPATTAGAIPPAAETARAPVNPASGHAVEGRGAAAPDRPRPPVTSEPEFSRPTADGTSEEVVPADSAAAATRNPMSGGGLNADMPSSALTMTGPASSGPNADGSTGAASPTRTAADQDTHATGATANAASQPTGLPGTVSVPDGPTEELDKPTADANTLASAARRLRHRFVIIALVILLAVIVVPIISRSYSSPSGSPPGSPAANPSASPSALASPTSGAAGTVVRVSGSGFPAHARVEFDFSGDRLGITTANGDGKFSNFAVTIPTWANPDKYEIDIVQEGGGAEFLVPFTVPSPSVFVSPASGAGGTVVRVSASSFPANTQVEITFQAQPLAETTTDAGGNISKFPVTIPTWVNGNPGTKFPIDVQVVSDGAIYAEKLFTVTG